MSRLTQALEGIDRFLRWWGGELLALIPPRYRARLEGPHADILVTRDRVEIAHVAGGAITRFVDPRPLDQLDPEAWHQLAALTQGGARRAVLAPPDIFVATLMLPKAAAGREGSAVALQIDQLAPIDPAALRWGHSARRADTGIEVHVAMARAEQIDAIAAAFHRAGHAAPPLHAAIEPGCTVLLAAGDGGASSAARADRQALLAAAALLLSIPVTTLLFAQFGIALLAPSVEARERLAAPRLAAERRVRQDEALKAALRPIATRPNVTGLLAELAAVLPPTAYVEQIEQDDRRQVRVVINSAEPDAAMAAVARMRALRGARLIDRVPGAEERTTLSFTASAR